MGIISTLRLITAPILSLLWVPLLYTVLSSTGIILALWENGDRLLDEREGVPENDEVFDFIVVGAGSAGSVVANRLSKLYNVLLLEAGGEPNPLQFIPGFALFLFNYPQIDWMHRSVPQKYSNLNSVNQQSSWSAGRGLGGSGNLNLMIHLRGHTNDFDNWAKITGDSSWSWEGVLPHFKSYEDYEDEGEERYHGYGGSLRIETPDYVGLGPEFVQAGVDLGYPKTDLNAPFSEGFDIMKFPIQYGISQTPYKAFIQPIRRRKTLTIRKFAFVTRVLLSYGNVAYGVEYDRHGQRRIALANKEVILSAGTITTPKILMHSGIGSAHHLSELGIPVLRDLPVGQNLQDHAAVFLGPFFINQPRSLFLDRDLTPSAFVQWFTGGRGVLSSTGAHAAGCISSTFAKARGEGNWPDTMLYYFGFTPFKTFGASISKAFNFKPDEQEKYLKNSIGKESFFVAVSGARPLSKGSIKLGGGSPYDALVIDPNYLTDHNNVDIQVLVEGVKTSLQLIENTTTLGEKFGARFTEERLPGCEHLLFRSDAYWECYSRRYTISIHHPVGTCSMGQVVDTQLRVLGTQRLRVIDASIQPVIIVTNTQASTIMIGEKGAHMILSYWDEIAKEATETSVHHGEGWYSGPYKVLTPTIQTNEYHADGGYASPSKTVEQTTPTSNYGDGGYTSPSKAVEHITPTSNHHGYGGYTNPSYQILPFVELDKANTSINAIQYNLVFDTPRSYASPSKAVEQTYPTSGYHNNGGYVGPVKVEIQTNPTSNNSDSGYAVPSKVEQTTPKTVHESYGSYASPSKAVEQTIQTSTDHGDGSFASPSNQTMLVDFDRANTSMDTIQYYHSVFDTPRSYASLSKSVEQTTQTSDNSDGGSVNPNKTVEQTTQTSEFRVDGGFASPSNQALSIVDLDRGNTSMDVTQYYNSVFDTLRSYASLSKAVEQTTQTSDNRDGGSVSPSKALEQTTQISDNSDGGSVGPSKAVEQTTQTSDNSDGGSVNPNKTVEQTTQTSEFRVDGGFASPSNQTLTFVDLDRGNTSMDVTQYYNSAFDTLRSYANLRNETVDFADLDRGNTSLYAIHYNLVFNTPR